MLPADNGKGVLQAVANVNDEIRDEVVGYDASQQTEIDRAMIELDGTPNKSRLGAKRHPLLFLWPLPAQLQKNAHSRCIAISAVSTASLCPFR